eukprot:COSAG04_NODE_29119_length_271_cov_0.598837_1_plen_23_part_01
MAPAARLLSISSDVRLGPEVKKE